MWEEWDEDEGGGYEAEGDVCDVGGVGLRIKVIEAGGDGKDDAHEEVEGTEEKDEGVEEGGAGAGEG